MVQLPNSLKDKTNIGQKIFATILLFGTLYGIIKIFNYIAPDLIEMFKNIYYIIFLGIPLFFITTYILMNPQLIWGFFKSISWKLTKWFIKMDPLSVMDRYADHLDKKLKNLEKTKVFLQGKKVKLERLIENLRQNIEDSFNKGVAARNQGEDRTASLEGSKVQTNKQTLNRYIPILQKLSKDINFLEQLRENWAYSNDKLRYTIDAKREEYINLKEMAKALGMAKEFARGDTEEAKLYNQSLKEFEEQVSLNIAKIEDFESSTKDLMSSLKVEKQMIEDQGLNILDNYSKQDLFMNVIPIVTSEENKTKFKLLK